jgi:hypothetical protein
MRRSVTAMLGLVIFCTLFGGAAAIQLPAVGKTSIQPGHFALLLLGARLLFSHLWRAEKLLAGIGQNIYLTAFSLYGTISAFILPKIFDSALAVVSMRPSSTDLYATTPLHFSPQNITNAVYLLGTGIAAILANIVARGETKHDLIVRTSVWLVWSHVMFGLLDVVLSSAGHADLFDFFRNGNYAQLEQTIGEYKRIAGTFPETSAYSAYGFAWLIFMTELWLRNVHPRSTGPAAMAIALVLSITTSASAYVGLGGYGALLFLRICFTPTNIGAWRVLMLVLFVLFCAVVLMSVAALEPKVWKFMTHILERMTVNKLSSSSGVQRTLWAKQGLEAFRISYGLGIGVGSFRSSSLILAILGSTGVIGVFTFLAHCVATLKPFDWRTHDLNQPERNAIGYAAGWAACLSLLPSLVTAPSADPGLLFGIFSGIALALVSSARQVSAPAPTLLRSP